MQARQGLLVPGAFNALSARVVADMGFEAVYLSGAGLTNMLYGLPDLAFIGLQDVAQATAAIRGAVDIPLIVDADTGFGNALNVAHTVKVLERAGADALQLEDQVFPKRCGHFSGKEVAPLAEMIGKIHAAVDARQDDNFMVIARTDARSSLGFEAAVERAMRMAEAGADIGFGEAAAAADTAALGIIGILLAAAGCKQRSCGGESNEGFHFHKLSFLYVLIFLLLYDQYPYPVYHDICFLA